MTSLPDNGSLGGPSRGRSAVDSTRSGASARSATDAEAGPAFRALFAELQARAAELRSSSQDVTDPLELRDAVDDARATLEGALTLGEQVLEAFRGALRLDEHAASEPTTDGPDRVRETKT